MNDPSEVLGIARDADLADIKRAYARALKANRPDDDAAAFGQVQAAYEACVERFRRQAAGATVGAGDFDGAGDQNEFVEGTDDDDAWGEASHDPDCLVLPQPLPGASDERVMAVVDAILAQAATMPAEDFLAWLRADERLYDLSFKHLVGDLTIERASLAVDDLPWRSLDVIHEFFEVDSVADPRLRRDFFAREAWLRVQGDARFARRLALLRHHYPTFGDRTVLAELFDPPDRGRWWKMHVFPTFPGLLRKRFQELGAEDPERAEAALSAHARDYWLPLTEPTRLAWRRVALVFAQASTVALALALLLSLSADGWIVLRNTWAITTGVLFATWLCRALPSLAYARYMAWRVRTVGAGEAPPGANILADRITGLAGASSLLTLVISVASLRAANPTTGLILQVWLASVSSLPLRVPRLRWEASLAVAGIAACVYPLLLTIGNDDMDLAILAAAPGAYSSGIIAVLLLDAAHARITHQSLAEVREATSVPQCALAAVAALAALAAWLV